MGPGTAARSRSRLARVALAALLAASAAGCAGARRAALREDLAAAPAVSTPPVAVPASDPPAPPAADAQPRALEPQLPLEHVEAHVRAQVARRMSGATPTTRRKVAATVLAESSRAGVDPLLVVALIHVESSFNPRARSRAGALGLMQVRVPTLREQLHRPTARRADALDPHTNVQAGVRYFRQLLDTFGATDLALMAYNAGPGRIQRLLAEGNIPPRIRDYSRKVVAELESIRNALLRPARAESLAAAPHGPAPELQAAAPRLAPPAVGAPIAR